jgi:Na+-translocating ferredoxin:NAD+ oxidoreductase subunit B
MTQDAYHRLAAVLDSLPNGFPATADGLEIRLLKKVFDPDEADLCSDLRLTFETAGQIALRSGRELDGLEELLIRMRNKGQIFGIVFGDVKVFRILPWIWGIYEFQVKHMDRELSELCAAYYPVFGRQFFMNRPQYARVIPIEEGIEAKQEALPFELVSQLIERSQSFAVEECVCKKEMRLMDKGCDKPEEVCMGLAPVPGAFDNHPWGRAISREEAYAVLRRAEEAGLVHMAANVQSGHIYICNCCGCCCGILRSINELGIDDSIASSYCARIDTEVCSGCGLCADERCQIRAIRQSGGAYEVIGSRCIGCGLCVTTCPTQAISLVRKSPDQLTPPPADEAAWNEERSRCRNVDFSRYR